jgi:hypothetical protein
MTRELAIVLLTSANVFLTDEGKKLLEQVVSEEWVQSGDQH